MPSFHWRGTRHFFGPNFCEVRLPIFERGGESRGSETARPIKTATVHSIRSGLIGSALSGSSGRHPSKSPLIPLSVDTVVEKQRVKRASPTHIDVQLAKLREPVTGSVARYSELPRYSTSS